MRKRLNFLRAARGAGQWLILGIILHITAAAPAHGQVSPVAPITEAPLGFRTADVPLAADIGSSQPRRGQIPPEGGHSAARGELAYRPPAPGDEFDLGGLVRRTLGISMVLSGICIGCMWWSHSRGGARGFRDTAGSRLQLLETIAVAPRCYLHLVRVQDQQFLVTRDATGFRTAAAVNSFESAMVTSEAAFVGTPATGINMTHEEQRREMQWTAPLSNR